jgi:8-oxo-dGTP diphosphatase
MTIAFEDFIPQLSIDCVIFGYQERKLKVLGTELAFGEGLWALPGGFIQQEESIDEAAQRILEERTGLTNIYLDQFKVFGAAKRSHANYLGANNPLESGAITQLNLSANDVNWLNSRFVSICYYALVDINTVSLRTSALDLNISWLDIHHLPHMILDHAEMVPAALETLRQNLDQKLIAFELLPETFTMRELQELYEAIFEKEFPRNNFQKKILDLNVLERLEKKFTGAANKAPYLYRFKRLV